MQIGTIIQDMAVGQQDIGLITALGDTVPGLATETWEVLVYTIFWVCPRPEGKDYTVSLYYTEDEVKEAFECGDFEVVEKRT